MRNWIEFQNELKEEYKLCLKKATELKNLKESKNLIEKDNVISETNINEFINFDEIIDPLERKFQRNADLLVERVNSSMTYFKYISDELTELLKNKSDDIGRAKFLKSKMDEYTTI